MANERITEGIVRDHFKADALFKSIKWEEQKSTNKRIAELLIGESKGGGKGNGYPEFIISFPTNSNYLIVVECKALTSKHKSANLENAKDYAVDGVLHYAKALKKEFSVIAIAVSGQNETELLVNHFYWKKGARNYSELPDQKLLQVGSYLQVFKDQFFISDFYFRDIANKARELNEWLYMFSIKELSRCTIISAIILALNDKKFDETYAEIESVDDLGESIISAIDAGFLAEEAEDEKDIVRNASLLHKQFEGILQEPLFNQKELAYAKGKKKESTLVIVKNLIIYLKQNIFPLVQHENVGYDIIGLFYTEFIRYAGSEQSLGLVLTPPHITELFCDLAELKLNDIVYDPCCGTGGFIVAAIQRLFKMAGNDIEKRKHIKRKQICGCELRSDMYTFACTNMRLRGDGKSNLYNGDCFANEKTIRNNHKPTVGFLNPPYGKTVSSARQMEFVEHALNSLNPTADGRVVAIVQMSCGIKDEKDLKAVKERLLKKHHLKAVLSMPDDLFYPVGVVTCIMVFEAYKPNKGRKTWFGYFKDDGFEKRKNLGRIDVNNRYAEIKEKWLSAYMNLDEIAGLSVRKEVNAKDEWCAEAYMETDYNTLSDKNFIRKMRDYVAFLIGNSDFYKPFNYSNTPFSSTKYTLNIKEWQWFKYNEVFEIKKGFYNKKPDKNPEGNIPFVGASDSNNGVTSYHDLETIERSSKTGKLPNASLKEKVFRPNCITVSNNGSVGYAFYQTKEFTCTHDVNPLYLNKKWNFNLNPFVSMFLCTLIEKEKYRWDYGRKWRPKRMPESLIKLPVDDKGNPDWQWMEDYIKGLPYSGCL